MNYTTLQLRGGSETEHMSGNGTGFIGEPKEVTVDTTNWTLRVHDGNKVGGHILSLKGEKHDAEKIIFSDGESLQEKLDNGTLGGGISPEPIPPSEPTNTPPKILTISVTNELSNGSCNISYYVEDKEETQFTHSISSDNGVNFKVISPSGTNPYSTSLKGLSIGSNVCAIRVSDGENETTKYFIVEIPNLTSDTAPIISNLYTSDITQNSFKIYYKATDKENHSIRYHKLSLDNGHSYTEVYPTLSDGEYVILVNSLNVGTTYFARLKVTANGLESNPYGFQVTTLTQDTLKNPLLTDGKNVYSLEVKNGELVPKINTDIDLSDKKVCSEIILNEGNESYKVKIINNVLSIIKSK